MGGAGSWGWAGGQPAPQRPGHTWVGPQPRGVPLPRPIPRRAPPVTLELPSVCPWVTVFLFIDPSLSIHLSIHHPSITYSSVHNPSISAISSWHLHCPLSPPVASLSPWPLHGHCHPKYQSSCTAPVSLPLTHVVHFSDCPAVLHPYVQS